jgi:uncharacterized protein
VIIETVVTTRDDAGTVNFAAMGVGWGEDRITIRPFLNTRTYKNLTRAGEAVVNVTDNVLIFAKSALTHEPCDSTPARHVNGVVLKDTCHWREVVVERIVPPAAGALPRAHVVTRVVGGGELRPFAGLCRAKHAVVEASILVSRLHLLPRDDVLRELDRLDVLVDKTGDDQEREAMAFIRAAVARRAARGAR